MSRLVPALILTGGLALRVLWLHVPAGMLDGDEAVFGLMAIHILDGRDFPLYCWGAHYAGALISYLGAAAFWLFGTSGIILKSTTLPFVAGYLIITHELARMVFDNRTARVALLLAAIPPAIPLAFSIKATGGYPETLCLGGLVLLLAFRLPMPASRTEIPRGRLALLGLVGGFGLYILPLILPYLAVTFFFLLARRRWSLEQGGWVWLLIGTILGASPMLIYNIVFPFATLLRLGSRVLEVSRSEALSTGINPLPMLGWIKRYVMSAPGSLWDIFWNLGALMGLKGTSGAVLSWTILTVTTLALGYRKKHDFSSPSTETLGRWLAWLVPGILLFAWGAGLNRSRHLVPLYSVLPIGLAALYDQLARYRPWVARASLALMLFGSSVNLIQAASSPSGENVIPLIQAVQQMETQGFYADYYISYQTMFASREAILASPTAWTSGGVGVVADRTPEVTRQVDQLAAPGYVFWHGSPQAEWFAGGLARRGIRFVRHLTGEFEIFIGLSEPIRSDALPIQSNW